MTAAGDVDEQAFRADAATEYRSDIEGLRAVAVVLVLLFHAGVPGVAGGYVGVDVFFVISGFLITGLIVRELAATGAVSLSHFYARRARRLLPVASVVLVSVLAVSALVLPLLRITEIATDIASAVAYVSNLRFGLQANNYFRQDAAQSPVLHFWSLSVEEQFYLLWPTILLVLFRVSGRIGKPMGGVFAGVALITFVSFVASLWLTNTHGSWAFYLLPTRAWELGLGGLLAVAAPRMEGLAPAAGTGGVWVGAAMIAAAAVLFDDNTPFPGTAAILPVVGAVLVIAGGFRSPQSIPSRLLGVAPMRFLGRISYSVYLWHWPMLVFAGIFVGSKPPIEVALPVVLAAIPLGAISGRLIESPFRAGRVIGKHTRINLVQALGSTVVVAALCVVASSTAQRVAASRLAGLDPPIGDVRPQPPHGWCLTVEEVADHAHCAHGDPASDTTVVLFGDSQAEQWFPALHELAMWHDWRLVSLSLYGCTSLDLEVAYKEEGHCPAWRAKALDRISAERPALVLLSNSARRVAKVGNRTASLTDESDRAVVMERWAAGLERTLAVLEALADNTAVIGETLLPGEDVPTCLSAHPDDFDACARPIDSVPREFHVLGRSVTEAAHDRYINPTPWLCPNGRCPVVMGQRLVYWDTRHLSGHFSRSLADALDAELPLLEGKKRTF